VLILTHRSNPRSTSFTGDSTTAVTPKRIAPALLGDSDRADGPVPSRPTSGSSANAARISAAYTIVICDEAHTALGEKTSAAIRAWTGRSSIGMTARARLIARHVTDLSRRRRHASTSPRLRDAA